MKKFLILTLLLTALALPASAEQPAAEQYRQIFASGNFYVEYEVADKSGHWISPEEALSSTSFWTGSINAFQVRPNSSLSSSMKYPGMVYDAKKCRNEIRAGLNGKRIAKSGSIKNKYPAALYQDGKYYKFNLVEKTGSPDMTTGQPRTKYSRNSIVLEEDSLYSPTLDPDEDWGSVRKDLTLPEAFCVLFPNDPMNDDAQISAKPIFNGDSKRTIDNKEYDCDQYINDIKNLAGTVIAQEAYNILYDGGKLVRIQKYLCRDGKELLVSDLIIKAISSEVPDEAFKIRKKFKLYTARNGDMNDLLDKPEQIGQIGGSK